MSEFHKYFYVITGAPCSGKTTLLHSLEDRHYLVMPEASQAIIQDQQAIGGKALPWENKSAYAELMLSWELRSYREAPKRYRPVIFDRGIPDIIGYLLLHGIPVPGHITRAADLYRYNKKVFIAPYWPEIYTADARKNQSEKEAQATYDIMMKTYSSLGYDLLVLPKDSLDKRIEFIKSHLNDEK